MSERTFSYHTDCPKCGSGDNLAVYDDGYSKCFGQGCGHYAYGDDDDNVPSGTAGAGTVATRPAGAGAGGAAPALLTGEAGALTKRKITEETCAKFKYWMAEDEKGHPCQVANYIRDGKVVAQKVRYPNKSFKIRGDGKDMPLFGQPLWRDGGKILVITEGELDALSVSQLQGNRWPVVSVPNGAQSAARSVRSALEWVEGYDKVVFMFDMDEPGQEAAKECAEVLTPGKAAIAHLPLKDANECLVAGRGKEVIDAMWGAKTYRPDGIVAGEEVWESIVEETTGACIPYPWSKLNETTYGLRQGELTCVTAGSGIGKSAWCRELAYYLLQQGETVGYIALEESVKRTALGLMGIHASTPYHLDFRNHSELDADEKGVRREAFDATVGCGRLYLYDHFGSTDLKNLLARVRYLAKGCGCRWIFLDHLSIVVSGIGGDEESNERRLIDNAMTKLRQLVEETGIGLVLVSHLKRPGGDKGHEEGLETHLGQLRGSAAIGQLSDMVIGLERNQQDNDNPHLMQMRVLKNRTVGITGLSGELDYSLETGRLSDVSHPSIEDF